MIINRSFLFTLVCSIGISSVALSQEDCSDEKLYASATQTRSDDRFDEFQKIYDQPSYKDGEKKFDKFIRKNLKLSDDAKTKIFSINYKLTVKCDGEIENIEILGDASTVDLTNLIEILEQTKGKWIPALKDGKTVNCIYFGKLFVNGADY